MGRQDSFAPEGLLSEVERLPGRSLCVGYSGGLDSTVLLHALLSSGPSARPLRALHVNHGLSPRARDWQVHCAENCARLGIELTVLSVTVPRGSGEGLEGAARRARYDAFAAALARDETLLLAHHADDQAETVLLQLLRGSGPRGLAGMVPCRTFASGWLARPLLGDGRAALARWAAAQGLRWVEDESNRDRRLDRAYLRHEVLPRLGQRWPGYARTIGRAAGLCAESEALLDAVARADLVRAGEPGAPVLDLSVGHELDEARRANLLRGWIRGCGYPLPGAARLASLAGALWGAAGDRQPLVSWPGAEVRRYRDRAYLGAPLPAHDSTIRYRWGLAEPLALGGNGELRAEPVSGCGLRAAALGEGEVAVAYRQGGERVALGGRRGHQSLQKRLQQLAVPPWLRDRVPLVFVAGELAAIADLDISAPFVCGPEEPGWRLRWRRLGEAPERRPD